MVGYFFGRRLHRELGVPVGLIRSAVGGTPAEFWTSREGSSGDPDLAHFVKNLDQIVADFPKAMDAHRETLAAFEKDKTAVRQDDTGWETVGCDDQAWKTMDLLCRREDAGLNLEGAVWSRRS